MESGPVTACIFDGALGTESVATATVITGVPDPDMTWLMALEYFTWAADPAVYNSVHTTHGAAQLCTLDTSPSRPDPC